MVGSHHHYCTRHGKNFEIVKHNLEFYKKKPSVAGARFFNNLPQYLKNKSDSPGFDRLLKDYLLENPLYSYSEFFG